MPSSFGESPFRPRHKIPRSPSTNKTPNIQDLVESISQLSLYNQSDKSHTLDLTPDIVTLDTVTPTNQFTIALPQPTFNSTIDKDYSKYLKTIKFNIGAKIDVTKNLYIKINFCSRL
jgi:hypothetical protein